MGPCKQLNSEAIRGAMLCYMSLVIAGHCSIISAKCFGTSKKSISRNHGTPSVKRETHVTSVKMRTCEDFLKLSKNLKNVNFGIVTIRGPTGPGSHDIPGYNLWHEPTATSLHTNILQLIQHGQYLISKAQEEITPEQVRKFKCDIRTVEETEEREDHALVVTANEEEAEEARKKKLIKI
ncbi:hypothetical protein ACROYT_G015504 [Oculina patagonica]